MRPSSTSHGYSSAGTVVKVDHSVSLWSRSRPRGSAADPDGVRCTRCADRGDASVQSPDACGGVPSHGDRLLAAGSDQGLPAVRRPSALRRRFPCSATEHARAFAVRMAHHEASVARFLELNTA